MQNTQKDIAQAPIGNAPAKRNCDLMLSSVNETGKNVEPHSGNSSSDSFDERAQRILALRQLKDEK